MKAMRRTFGILLCAAVLAAAAPAFAHHSFAAAYFEDQIQQIEGDIAVIQYRNPHTFIHVDVKEEKGIVTRYSIEWGSGIQLTNQGVGRTTLKTGDHVKISGNPGRVATDHRLRMRTIERPADGWKWGGTFD
jgi:hypothetical protein